MKLKTAPMNETPAPMMVGAKSFHRAATWSIAASDVGSFVWNVSSTQAANCA